MPFTDPDERRAWHAVWRRLRRAKWVRDNGPCKDCGSAKRLCIYQNDTTKPRANEIITYAKAKRDPVLSTCDVVCASCLAERVRRINRVHDSLPHGTLLGYKHYKCRCDPCKTANRNQVRLQRARQSPEQQPRSEQ